MHVIVDVDFEEVNKAQDKAEEAILNALRRSGIVAYLDERRTRFEIYINLRKPKK